MACSTCGGNRNRILNRPTAAQAAAAAGVQQTPDNLADVVRTFHGIDRPVMSQMTASRPSSGWTGTITKGKITLTATGIDAAAAVSDMVRKFQAMKIPISLREIWLRLNLQWMERTGVATHFTPIATIAAMVAELDRQPEAAVAEQARAETPTPSHGPSEWGSIGWKFLGLWLARGNYSPDSFRRALESVLTLLDEDLSPVTGCSECHGHFADELQKLSDSPETLATVASARMWLWDFHNRVNARLGKRALSFDEAVRKNYWN